MSGKRELKYVGVDYWCRPLFKDRHGNVFGSVDKLVNDIEAKEDNILDYIKERDIVLFGYNGYMVDEHDPLGTPVKPEKIRLVLEFTEEDKLF